MLVDDTPLAFLHQPCNGVPVLGFRGDPDDRLLMEAVLPLLQVSPLLAVASTLGNVGCSWQVAPGLDLGCDCCGVYTVRSVLRCKVHRSFM